MNGYGSHTFLWYNADGDKFWVKYHIKTDHHAVRVGGRLPVQRRVAVAYPRWAAIRSRYQANDALGVRRWVAESRWTRPNR